MPIFCGLYVRAEVRRPAFSSVSGHHFSTSYKPSSQRLRSKTFQNARRSRSTPTPELSEMPACHRHGPLHVHAITTRHQPFLRSEEHTSELQSLRHLVCR